MTDLIVLFLNNLLPIFLGVAIGFILGKYLHIPARPLSQVAFYLFSPCLIFRLLTTSQLAVLDILKTIAYMSLLMLSVGGLAWLFGRSFRLERSLLTAVVLTSIFMNAGNYGLPVTLFAFGEDALAYATLTFVTMNVLINTVGVLIATSDSVGILQALKGLLRLPAPYALVLAMIFLSQGWQLPLAIDRTVTIFSNAAIPTMMLLLGIQLQSAHWVGQTKALALATTMRLVVSPILAIGFSRLWGISGSAYQASVLQSAMPAAIFNTVIATEFDVEPSFVTAVVFATTVISPFTLTPLLAYLGA